MMSHSSHSAPPPPAPQIDPAAAGAYGSYSQTGYSVDNVQHPLPPLSEAMPSNQNAQYPQSIGNSYSTDHRDSIGHVPYDQAQSSNFFDSNGVDAPQAATHHVSNGASGYGSSNTIMTPPAGASSHSVYSSSPYQASTAPMFHRASISGPVMHNHFSSNAPPTASSASHSASAGDIWNAQTAARPHTADGMFTATQMGGLPGQWSMPEYGRGPRGSTSSVLSDTPSASGKVFSYMSNGDDMSTTSSGGGGPYSSGAPRKRPRRRFDEIERLYQCKWPGCQKSYGTLNHLNAHVAMQKHGAKRSPAEFKEMRKAWRKGKREEEQRRQANQAAANEEALARKGLMFQPGQSSFMPHGASNTSPPIGAGNGGFHSSTSPSFGSAGQQPIGSGQHMMAPPPSSSSMMGMSANSQIPRYHTQSNSGLPGAPGNGNNFYSGGAGSQSSGGLGAYLMAHRGSI